MIKALIFSTVSIFAASSIATECDQQFVGLWKTVVSDKDDSGKVIDPGFLETIVEYKKDGTFTSVSMVNPVSAHEESKAFLTSGDWRCKDGEHYVNISKINNNSVPSGSWATFYDIKDQGKNLVATYDRDQHRTYVYIRISGDFEKYRKLLFK